MGCVFSWKIFLRNRKLGISILVNFSCKVVVIFLGRSLQESEQYSKDSRSVRALTESLPIQKITKKSRQRLHHRRRGSYCGKYTRQLRIFELIFPIRFQSLRYKTIACKNLALCYPGMALKLINSENNLDCSSLSYCGQNLILSLYRSPQWIFYKSCSSASFLSRSMICSIRLRISSSFLSRSDFCYRINCSISDAIDFRVLTISSSLCSLSLFSSRNISLSSEICSINCSRILFSSSLRKLISFVSSL